MPDQTTDGKLKISKIIYNNSDPQNHRVSTDRSEVFSCQFNPENFKMSKKNQWVSVPTQGKDMPELTFRGGESQSMTIAFVFDSTEDSSPVYEKYSVLKKLAEVDPSTKDNNKLGKTSWVKVQWGTYMSYSAVITGLDEEFTLFLHDGTPLRAKVSVTLKQVLDPNEMGAQNPTSRSEPRRTWIVQEGQRLDWIAYTEYGDSAAWREIANENNIDDPFNLRAGQVLRIPLTR